MVGAEVEDVHNAREKLHAGLGVELLGRVDVLENLFYDAVGVLLVGFSLAIEVR